MTVDDAIQAIGATADAVSIEAARWLLDNWDDARSSVIAAFQTCADDDAPSELAAQGARVALVLMAEKRETGAFASLCALLQAETRADQVLSVLLDTSLTSILISTFDGNATTIESVIEATAGDEQARFEAFTAMAYLTQTSRISETEMRGFLVRTLAEMQPRRSNFCWAGWVSAVSLLGYSDLAKSAEGLIRSGLCPDDVIRVVDFKADLRKTLRSSNRISVFAAQRIAPFADVIAVLADLNDWTGDDIEDLAIEGDIADVETEDDPSEEEIFDEADLKRAADEFFRKMSRSDRDALARLSPAEMRALATSVASRLERGEVPPVEHEDDDAAALTAAPDQPAVQISHREPYPGVGRNAPCPCGSGRKYKKCCLR